MTTHRASLLKLPIYARWPCMATTAIDDRFAAALLLAVFPDPKPTTDNPRPKTGHAKRKRGEIFSLYNGGQRGSSGPGMVTADGKRTAYALYNSVTEYAQHMATRRNPKGATMREKSEGFMRNNLMSGTDDRMRATTLDSILRNIDFADGKPTDNTAAVDSILDQIAFN